MGPNFFLNSFLVLFYLFLSRKHNILPDLGSYDIACMVSIVLLFVVEKRVLRFHAQFFRITDLLARYSCCCCVLYYQEPNLNAYFMAVSNNVGCKTTCLLTFFIITDLTTQYSRKDKISQKVFWLP